MHLVVPEPKRVNSIINTIGLNTFRFECFHLQNNKIYIQDKTKIRIKTVMNLKFEMCYISHIFIKFTKLQNETINTF